MLAPIDCIWFSAYCLPVRPMVTTTIRDAVPITMPNAVRTNLTLLIRNESTAMLTISLKTMVSRAVSAKGRLVIFPMKFLSYGVVILLLLYGREDTLPPNFG